MDTELKVLQLMGFSMGVPPAAELLCEFLVSLRASHRQSVLSCAICNDTFANTAILYIPAPIVAAACILIGLQIDAVSRMPSMTDEQRGLSLKFFASRVSPLLTLENAILYRPEWGSYNEQKIADVELSLMGISHHPVSLLKIQVCFVAEAVEEIAGSCSVDSETFSECV